ncbi:histone H2A deubiquitinase MYSM1 [Asbolus verrucosus]|uniref:Myb-like, SWIRM and MPN domain-containing protein 1 n=1 Tax=Asbolus verrucosus TaxID=1661398 RepID=A0A482WBL9_ASBVE|nr:histone H2A deubiquitinase MYSM1 [Asbolus verrucosus]
MAEDDEIDILGDFNLDSFLTKNDSSIYENTSLVSQNSELLNCDYTIHPQWLLDKPSANPDCWYDTSSVLSTGLSEKPNSEFGNGDNDNLGHVFTENSITDESGWTEKEKNLLERGIEIFGKSNIRLSQFIGSRTPSEVKYYLKNFYMETQTTYSGFNSGIIEDMNIVNDLVSDILDDTQIPASIEEVIAAVSTAKSTIQVNKQSRKKSNSYNSNDDDEINYKDIPSGHSLLKHQNLKTNHENGYKYEPKKKVKNKIKQTVKFKIKTKLKFPMNHVKQKTVKIMNQENKKTEIGRIEITTGKGLAVPICEGEEIVKISKDDSDSDVEIDVEDADEFKAEVNIENITEDKPKVVNNEIEKIENENGNLNTVNNKQQKIYIDLSILDESIVKELTNLEQPKSEVTIDENFISELEKIVHSEFFEGRPTKTPLRYLKIRNHIISCWLSIKPAYVTKTSIRQGLKNCGDVNCISRIHCYLEQIGAINFGCLQTSYIRPLFDVFQAIAPATRDKSSKDNQNQLRQNIELGCRPRIRRKFANDGEGGCTLTHDEKGDVINTTIVNEEPPKPKMYIKKPTIRLIYCRPFPEGNPQKYTVKMHLTTLLLMDFHAHTLLTEVMGLVGGTWNAGKKVLTISHYEPCRNMASSATHCDMCPVSQSKAAELIHNQGLDILGWFHSHPTFAPEPSQQDLDTQQDVQLWIGSKTPCLGVILSPFSSHGALIASPFRCMMVDKKENFEDLFVPYKFQVEIVSNEIDIERFLADLSRIFSIPVGVKESKIDFNKPYFQDNSITYLEKYITSVRMHLAKCGTLNKMTCDYIIESISNSLLQIANQILNVFQTHR